MRKKLPDSKFTTLRFVFIAVVFMLLADFYIFGGKRSYIEEAKQSYHAEQTQSVVEEAIVPEEPPVTVAPDDGAAFFEEIPVETIENEPVIQPSPEEEPEAALPPVTMPGPFKGRAKVAIIIDDLGMDVKRSRQIVDLPAPITLAFLPYGTKTVELAKIGKAKGHELIIHTPMQAVDTKQNIGPMGLKANMDQATFDSSFNQILQSFDGYDGINNHMGSLLTQDEVAMTRLMGHLKANNLFFVDSKTIGRSVAAREAREAGVPYAVRDVFLDHENTRGFVDNALMQVERKALRDGSAIAIGHPKDVTIAGLKAWLPTLSAKGIEVVPVKALLIRPVGSVAAAGASADEPESSASVPLQPEPSPSLSSRPERSEVEGSRDTIQKPDPSASLGMTREGDGMTGGAVTEGQDGITESLIIEPEISPEVRNAFEEKAGAPVLAPRPEENSLPAIY